MVIGFCFPFCSVCCLTSRAGLRRLSARGRQGVGHEFPYTRLCHRLTRSCLLTPVVWFLSLSVPKSRGFGKFRGKTKGLPMTIP